jgi:hypothetical protein
MAYSLADYPFLLLKYTLSIEYKSEFKDNKSINAEWFFLIQAQCIGFRPNFIKKLTLSL